MAEYYEIEDRLPVIKQWYDGYLFGDSEVYNPWSIINYVRDSPEFPMPYWANTSGNDLVKMLISKGDADLKFELQDLIEGIEIEKPIDDNVVFPDLEKGSGNVWSFLLFSGYLRLGAKWSDEQHMYYKLTIPNKEVKTIYQNIILQWASDALSNREYDNMMEALFIGEHEFFSRILNKYLSKALSYFDSAESFYHGLFLGMAMRLSNKYTVKSNRESGLGRFDIMLIPKNTADNGIIIEFKTPLKGTIEDAARDALKQIEEKRYEQELIEAGCTRVLKYGIAFEDKEAYVLMGN
jgi:hypothetical protein